MATAIVPHQGGEPVTAPPGADMRILSAHNALVQATLYLERGDVQSAQRKTDQALASLVYLTGVRHA